MYYSASIYHLDHFSFCSYSHVALLVVPHNFGNGGGDNGAEGGANRTFPSKAEGGGDFSARLPVPDDAWGAAPTLVLGETALLGDSSRGGGDNVRGGKGGRPRITAW